MMILHSYDIIRTIQSETVKFIYWNNDIKQVACSNSCFIVINIYYKLYYYARYKAELSCFKINCTELCWRIWCTEVQLLTGDFTEQPQDSNYFGQTNQNAPTTGSHEF